MEVSGRVVDKRLYRGQFDRSWQEPVVSWGGQKGQLVALYKQYH